RDGVVAGAQLQEIAAGDQTGQGQFEFHASVTARAQFAHQLLEAGAGMRQSSDVLEQAGIAHTYMQRYCRADRQTVSIRGCTDVAVRVVVASSGSRVQSAAVCPPGRVGWEGTSAGRCRRALAEWRAQSAAAAIDADRDGGGVAHGD